MNPSISGTSAGRVVVLVQARMGSQRLPGKMLMDLCGHPVLHWVLARTGAAVEPDAVVLATTTSPGDAPLAALAAGLGVSCFRGSEADVLGRFAAAALAHEADTIVRVCADNPLIAPEEIDRLVRFYRAALADGADPARLHASNCGGVMGGEYPDGLGAEAFSSGLLRRLAETARTPQEREHVTAAILARPEEFDIRAAPSPPELVGSNVKLDVDTPEDLERLRRLCAALDSRSSAAEIMRAYAASMSELS